jgi:hypothetical protein
VLAPCDPKILGGHAGWDPPAVLLRLAHVLGAGRGADHLAAGLDIGVAENEVTMRVVLVLAFVVKSRQPEIQRDTFGRFWCVRVDVFNEVTVGDPDLDAVGF